MASKEGYFQLIPIFTLIFMICHVSACLWHFIGYYDTENVTWVNTTGYRNEEIWDRYTVSVYFILQTVLIF